MARERSDREDLMAEAVALLPRVRFTIGDSASEFVAGARPEGGWSIYCDGDPVYQLDAQHKLRRAFVDDRMYRSVGGTLARLTRQESATATTLLRHDLLPRELTEFLARMRARLAPLQQALQQRRFTVVETIPVDAAPLDELSAAILACLESDQPLSQAVGKRR